MQSLEEPTIEIDCLAQRDSTRKHVKNLDVILGAAQGVVILDDTEGVWPDHRDNLILVLPTHL